ncbi:MAG TPA: winged helix DNA-binding protein [Microvirga sp.]|jgi:DNA-binding MarR family transcriptional regulator|nr:winged helix DNA-binding protein [Microvirga sp.]
MTGGFFGLVALAERLHRRTLDLLEGELARLGCADVNATQASILLHMGADEMTVSELTLRGCYQGTNVSYNLGKLVEGGYVVQERSERDRRVVKVRASDKGYALSAQLKRFYAALEADLADSVAEPGALADCEALMARCERFALARLSMPASLDRPQIAVVSNQVVWPTGALHSQR